MIREIVLREFFDEYVENARKGWAAINYCRRLGCGTLISQIGVRHTPKGDHAIFWCPTCRRWWTVPQRKWHGWRVPDAEGPHCEWPFTPHLPYWHHRHVSRKTKAREAARERSRNEPRYRIPHDHVMFWDGLKPDPIIPGKPEPRTIAQILADMNERAGRPEFQMLSDGICRKYHYDRPPKVEMKPVIPEDEPECIECYLVKHYAKPSADENGICPVCGERQAKSPCWEE